MNENKMAALMAVGFAMTASQASATDLATWIEGAKQEFKAEQCVTIPGTPGVSSSCSPDAKIPYPCPTWNKPGKTCHAGGMSST